MSRRTGRTPAPSPTAVRRPLQTAPAPDPNGATRELAGEGLLQLQRTIGNQQVQALLDGAGGRRAAAQVHATGSRESEGLDVGESGDRWERAADRAADRVAGSLPSVAERPGPGGALPDQVREPFEKALGADLSGVRLHSGPEAVRLSTSLGAEAFTSGRDIWLGRGGFDAHSMSGRRLLAHELTHVMQQSPDLGQSSAPGVQLKPLADERAEANRQYLKQRFGGGSAKNIKKRLKKRLPNGPGLTAAELRAIDSLSTAGPGARQWLEAVGLGTTTEADTYLGNRDYSRWLKLGAVRRLHYASRALIEGVGRHEDNPPPAYTLGRHMAVEKGDISDKARARFIAERDENIEGAFIAAMQPADPAFVATRGHPEAFSVDRASRILRRVFLLMHAGVAVYDKTAADHIDYGGSLARLLAHGGRVNIRIPSLDEGGGTHDLTDWLGITQGGAKVKGTAHKRGFATHHMSIESNRDVLGRERDAEMKEKGGKLASAANVVDSDVELYGVDLTAGGYGRLDFNGDVILPDGAHGHMFIGFTRPDFYHDGALQIGIESTAPGAHSPVGYEHTWRSTEATANPESSFYGHKSAKVGGGSLKHNQRLIDLRDVSEVHDMHWLSVLEAMEASWDALLKIDPDAWKALVGPAMGQG